MIYLPLIWSLQTPVFYYTVWRGPVPEPVKEYRL